MFFRSLLLTNTVEVFGDIDPSIIFHPLMSKHVAQKNRYGVTLFWRITRRRDWWSCWRQTRDCVEGQVPGPSSHTKTSFHRGTGCLVDQIILRYYYVPVQKGFGALGAGLPHRGKHPIVVRIATSAVGPSIGRRLRHHHHHHHHRHNSWLHIGRENSVRTICFAWNAMTCMSLTWPI
jgi:hypothetical protein